ncbi:MAG: hypothetical protein ICV53_23250 [Flavisolibacter sp.]|nr:hypothetical protein [Flavisolibacter sp.]
MTHDQYDAILSELESRGKLYDERRISHVSFDRNGTWCVVDVWESAESFNDFAQSQLMSIFAKLGINVPQPTVLPAHLYLGAHAEASISV